MHRMIDATGEEIRELTDLFRALSDPTRLKILALLMGGEKNVGDLCGELNVPQPTVSHHLGLLRMTDVIVNRRQGKHVFYSLNGRTDVAPGGDSLSIRTGGHAVRIASPSPAADTAAAAATNTAH